jgi:PKD repeat protein
MRCRVSSSSTWSNITTKTIDVHEDIPVASFTANLTNGNAPLAVQFTDASTGSQAPTIWDWDWDYDGSFSSGSSSQNPLHTYSTGGIHTVGMRCRVSSSSTWSNITTKTIDVHEDIPVASFTANSTNGNVPLAVQFTGTSTGSPAPTIWDWDWSYDGSFSSGSSSQNPSHTFSTAGVYTVGMRCRVSSSSTWSNITTKTIYVNTASAVADFIGNPVSGTKPLSVVFTSTNGFSANRWSWNFGDGTTNSTQNPTHPYQSAGIYTVTMTAYRSSSPNSYKTVTKTNYITVTEPITLPVSNFDFAANGLSIQFTDTSSNSPTGWAWDFGDGQTSDQQSPQHTYAAAGTYSVKLNASNTAGAGNQVTKDVIVTASSIEEPVTTFTATPAGLSVHFVGSSTGGTPDSWSWKFGDGNTADTKDADHTYASAGTYTVELTATNTVGSNNTTQQITVIAPTVPTFTATPAGLSVHFVGSSTGGIPDSWSWKFGDGNTADTKDADHTYASAGTYTVELTATNTAGSNNTTQQITVIAPIDFTVTPQTGDVPLLVTVKDISTTNDGSRQWIIDGFDIGLTDQTIEYPLDTIGTHNITLIEYDSDGVKFDDVTKQVIVNDVPVKADFIASGSYGYAHFEDNCSGAPTELTWNFGDGEPSETSGQGDVNHVYDKPGVYNVILTAIRSSYTSTVTKQVTILSEPVVNFTATPEKGVAPLTVQFNDTSDPVITSLSWDFGDENNSNDEAPVNTYTTPGEYTVVLLGTTQNETYQTYTQKTIIVTTPVTAGFTSTVNGLNVTFNDTSSGIPNKWSWNFGDGQTSVDSNPKNTYARSGTYTVTLTVTNADGNTNSTNANVIVIAAAPVAKIDMSPSTGIAPFSTNISDVSTGEVDSRVWAIDDIVSNNTNISFLYTFSPGNHTVGLTVTGGGGSASTSQTINVGLFVFPGCTKAPTDPDHDGLYEDINGNGQLEFTDVVILFNNWDLIPKDQIAYFDFNHNGDIDFNDIVMLYNMI